MSIDPVKSAVVLPSTGSVKLMDKEPVPKTNSTPAPATPIALPQARSLEVSASYGSGLLVIYRIIDKATGQLIEQIPPEQFLDAERGTQEAEGQGSGEKLNLKF